MASGCCCLHSEVKHGHQGHRQPEGEFCIANERIKKEGTTKEKKTKKAKKSSCNAQEIAQHKCELDKNKLKCQLEECIKKFDENSPDTMASLARLNAFIEGKVDEEVCYPKKEWPHCPAKEGQDAYEVPHPYLPGRTLYAKPQSYRENVLVTMDGRLATRYKPRKYFHEEPPLVSILFLEVCYPKKEWPHCPAKEGQDAYEVPHPYLPGRTLYAKPQSYRENVLVTMDGRLATRYKPRKYFHEEPPLNVPPWVLPRYKSQELRAGQLYQGCQCWKKNGLQDDCPRWDCGGSRPECRVRPLPVCPPSMNPPICGVRKPNLYDGKPPKCGKERPPPPYPTQDISVNVFYKEVPKAPSLPCLLHK
uniref:Uncharacterized protein n=1 Tax=Rhodnius prolixus TaxID=13249 RepID=T1I4C2_RHOPR